MWSAVGQHDWVLGNRGLNQITGQVNHLDRLSDVVSDITGEHYTRDFPNVRHLPAAPGVSRRSTPAPAAPAARQPTRYVFQIKDDVSLLTGNHALKFGVNYNTSRDLGTPERERALSRRSRSSTIRR